MSKDEYLELLEEQLETLRDAQQTAITTGYFGDVVKISEQIISIGAQLVKIRKTGGTKNESG